MVPSQKRKTLFLCYLFLSSLGISLAQNRVTDQQVNEITEEFLELYGKELDALESSAPENPDNDLDNEDRGRIFFLLPFLPKLIIVLVKVAIKVAPIVIKAAVAVKAKAAAVAAAGLAKVSTGAALKATAISVGKKVLADVVISSAIDVVTDAVTDAISPPQQEQAQPQKGPKQPNIFNFYNNDEVCECDDNTHCSCCVSPDNFERGCLNVTLTGTLWNDKTDMKIGAFYGGKEIMTRTLSVAEPAQKCQQLNDPFKTVKMCVTTFGRTREGRVISQCISVHFNARGLTKCLEQDRKNNLQFEED